MSGWSKLRALIPNKPGLKLEVQLADGSIKLTEVVLLGGDGIHVLRDVRISDVVAWRRALDPTGKTQSVALLEQWLDARKNYGSR